MISQRATYGNSLRRRLDGEAFADPIRAPQG
jgi:hypothetical protein